MVDYKKDYYYTCIHDEKHFNAMLRVLYKMGYAKSKLDWKLMTRIEPSDIVLIYGKDIGAGILYCNKTWSEKMGISHKPLIFHLRSLNIIPEDLFIL